MRHLIRPLSASALALLASLFILAGSAFASPGGVVISQVYGGGGNSGATYRNDFIELFNAGPAPVSLNAWSVQYTSSAGARWQVTALGNVGKRAQTLRGCPRFCLRFTKRGGPPQGGAPRAASPAYSGLIPAAFTVFCAPARSDRMRVPSASGEPPNTSTPS